MNNDMKETDVDKDPPEAISAFPAAHTSRWQRMLPAITLIFMAPLTAEILPGATRFSALFVFPIEVCVWGGGALLIRYAVRRWRLGWLNMLLLAAALAVAEECLIQQTSLAPLVIQLKGEVYARSMGVNYVYLLWALVYEPVFVIFLPIHLVELIFSKRREELWIGRVGLVSAGLFFLLGSYFAWFTWTRIARPNVFHLPIYNPPPAALLIAIIVISGLILSALGPFRKMLADVSAPLRTPPSIVLGLMGAVWAVLWFGLVLLAFGIAPSFPPAAVVCLALLVVIGMILLVPRWTASSGWLPQQEFALIMGTMVGSMLIGFIGFIGSTDADFYFKLITNIVAVALLIRFGFKIRK